MVAGGFGAASYGGGPYGGSLVELAGEDFDVFCFRDLSMFQILTHADVDYTPVDPQFYTPNPSTLDLEICSGGSKDPDNARLWVSKSVGDTFTVEWICKFHNLPNDFTDLTHSHIYFGATDAAGALLGLFFSKIGVAYTGSVSFVGDVDLQLDCTFQQLPGSSAYIDSVNYWVVRAAVSYNLGIVYLYITKLTDVAITGHQLRAILPIIPYTAAANPATDQVIVSVRGTGSTPSCAFLDSMCLGTSLIIPNLAPEANAGLDQAVRLCSIAQLDGSASFDPEGASLGYQWRLVEGPTASEFVEQFYDGQTSYSITGFVDRFYSQSLGALDATDPLEVGDVLNIRGGAYTIIGKGLSIVGDPTPPPVGTFYVRIGSEILPDELSAEPFKYLRQRGISGPTEVKPTFFPQVPGFFSFDLVVHDGQLSSSPSRTIVNVLESPLPRGCTPDLTFLFSYLSDFWKLVEDRDRIAVFWSAVAQVVATELFTLWQYEYSKSLRDIQRTFVRRWLHYDLLLPEPMPELTQVRALYGGVESITFGGLVVQGEVLHIISDTLEDEQFFYTFTPSGYATPQTVAADLQAKLQSFADSRFSTQVITDSDATAATGSYLTGVKDDYTDGQTFTLDDGTNPPVTFEIDKAGDGVTPGNVSVDIHLLLPLSHIDGVVRNAINAQEVAGNLNIVATASLWTAELTNTQPGEGGNRPISYDTGTPGTFSGMDGGTGGSRVRIEAPFPFSVGASTTTLFTIGGENHSPSGSGGAGIGSRTYKVDTSLEGLDVQEDDFLSVGGVAYRISSVLNNSVDSYTYQRVVVKEDLPTAPSTEWSISGWVSSELIDFYRGLVAAGDYADFECSSQPTGEADTDSTFDLVECRVLGVSPTVTGRVAFDVWPLGGRLVDDTLQVLLARILRRTYAPISPLVKDVPTLQEFIVIEDDEATLRRNVDYFLEDVRGSKALRFSSGQAGDLGDVWEGERPPNRLWAEYTYLNNNPLIEANFGLAAGFTEGMLAELPSSVDYLSAVRGLWYAFYNGPTLKNLRIGVQILLGLPFAEQAGTIEEIRTDFSATQGRILIRDTERPEIVRSYTFPKVLEIEVSPETGERYVAGDTVEQFAPLVEGAEVVDYVSDPDWFEGVISQGIFYEVEKYHKFLVRVEEAAFDLEALLFAQDFILKAKPTYTYPLFFVRRRIEETEVSVTDNTQFHALLKIHDSPSTELLGQAFMVDQPRPGGGGWRNQVDKAPDGGPPPVLWGVDKGFVVVPEDDAVAALCETFSGSFVVKVDSVFAVDIPVSERFKFEHTSPSPVPAPPGGLVVTPVGNVDADLTGTVSRLRFITQGDPNSDHEVRSVLLYDLDQLTFTDYTGAPSIPLLPPTGDFEVGDAVYFACDVDFELLWLDIVTAGVGGWTLEWEYWNGIGYAPLPGLVDNTGGFMVAGVNSVSFTKPGDWEPVMLDYAAGPHFYIRARIAVADAPTTRPVAQAVTTLGTDYEVVVQNTTQVTEVVESFTAWVNTEILRTISLAVTAGDTLAVVVRPASGSVPRDPNWTKLQAYLLVANADIWEVDETMGDGNYCIERDLV